MHIKFFKAGRGGGAGPTNYLTSNEIMRDGVLIARDPLPEVLRGNVRQTCQLIDSSHNTWKYTSGVIAFHRDDAPSEQQQKQIMDDFEQLAFAGLEPQQYDILWVRHAHEGNIELHMVVPRIELTTGKSLNIAPPGHLSAFDTLRDLWNHENNWARPDDPARQRIVSTPENTRNPLLKERKEAREEITEWLLNRVHAGTIQDRSGVVESLKEIGQVTRKGKDYVSVKPDGFKKPIRLKGVLYEEKFSIESVRNFTEERASGQHSADAARKAAATARAGFERHCEHRASYHAKRYQKPNAELGETSKRNDARNAEPAKPVFTSNGTEQTVGNHQPTLVMAESDSPDHHSLSDYLKRQLGPNSLVDKSSFEHKNRNTEEQTSDGEFAERLEVHIKHGRGSYFNEKRTRNLQVHIRRLGNEIKQIVQVSYDRVRDKINSAVTSFRSSLNRARESFNEASTQLAGNSHQLAAAAGDFDTAVGKISRTTAAANESIRRNQPLFSRGIAAVRGNRTDELQQFKTDISLPEYAAENGYLLIKNESSRNSFVMQRESDNDKIIVATDTDGHGIYFSVRDDADNGTIIDFVQKRKGLNLGQLRQELRPYIGETREAKQIKTKIGKPRISNTDSQKAALSWSRATAALQHDYLESRGIKRETLKDTRFAGVIRTDTRNNALFAHYNSAGISGFEIKNEGFTGFAAGGQKGLWLTSNINSAKRVVITETGIDALSHAQYKATGAETAYLSFAGSMSPEQKELLIKMFGKMNERSQSLVLATDSDAAGKAFNKQLIALAPESLKIDLELPDTGKDWNETIQRPVNEPKQKSSPNRSSTDDMHM